MPYGESIASTINYLDPRSLKLYLKTIWIDLSFTSRIVSEGNAQGYKKEHGLGDIPAVNVCSHGIASKWLSQ